MLPNGSQKQSSPALLASELLGELVRKQTPRTPTSKFLVVEKQSCLEGGGMDST